MTIFLAAALLLIGAAAAIVVVPLFREREAPAPIAAVVAALGLPAAAILLYSSITSYPWRSGLPAPASPAGTPQEAQAGTQVDLAALEAATRSSPQDVEAWLALGDGYVEAERFPDGLGAYTRADQLAQGRNPDARLGIAEVRILQDKGNALGEAGQMVEQVLATNPDSAKALWYGGMVALARNDPAAARSRWQRLLDMGPPQPVRHVLEQQLARLDGGKPAEGPRPESPAVPAAAGGSAAAAGIALEVSVADDLKSRVKGESALFVIARDPGRPGPPVAVVRRTAAELPLRVALTDANVMVPGQSLGDLAQVKVTARISASGNPMPAAGDVYGEALWARGSAGPLRIRLDKVFGTP